MWNGALVPLYKSIGTVTFIPLLEMTDEDWDWLDFKNLRPEAKNRIAREIVNGELEGFFDVRIEEKARAKNRYLWPASRTAKRRFEEANEPQHDFFRNEVGDGLESDEFFDLDEAMASVTYRGAAFAKGFSLWVTLLALNFAKSSQDDEFQKEVESYRKDYNDMTDFVKYFLLIALLSKMLRKAKNRGEISKARRLQDMLDELLLRFENEES